MKSQLPAVDPAFWNITSNSSNSKPGDFESDMIKMLYSTGIDLQKENQALKDRIKRLEEAGDEAICPLEYAARVRIWTKAKESK
jgi:hypothetical protein